MTVPEESRVISTATMKERNDSVDDTYEDGLTDALAHELAMSLIIVRMP